MEELIGLAGVAGLAVTVWASWGRPSAAHEQWVTGPSALEERTLVDDQKVFVQLIKRRRRLNYNP